MASHNQINGRSHPHANSIGSSPASLNGQFLSRPHPQAPAQWDAAALLNPKAHRSQPAKDERTSFQSFQPNGAQAQSQAQPIFQFDTPSGAMLSSQPLPQPRNLPARPGQNGFSQTNGGGTGAGMGHMLERMHNVTERDLVPQKRQKIRHEDERNDVKGHFSGGGKGGVLGEYVKDKREEGRKEAAVNGTRPPVDLTTEEDQDLVVVGSSDDKEVCYGRIEGADINAHQVPTPRPGTTSISSTYWPQVKVILRRKLGDRSNMVPVFDSTKTQIGCLDVNTAIGLAPILDSPLGIRTSARILTRPKKPEDLPPGSACSTRFNLDLTLYGPKKLAGHIGRHLSQKQLWLRTPLFVDAGIELNNPHATQKIPQLQRPGGVFNRYGSSSFQARTVEEIRNDVMGMFDSLEKSENLPEMEQDPRILTNLLSHQKQGLYFMTNKEKERVFGQNEADNSSLWRLRIDGRGSKSYYNVITSQEERQSPPQVLGGILADMMGLGKTLSILALVVASLKESTEWARKEPPPPREDETPLKLNSRATLLVSPLSTIANWEEQIAQHVAPGTLKYHIYHGSNRIKDVRKLADFDLVITTYGSVASECNKVLKGKGGEIPLEEVNWFRVVLDEAHMIREQLTVQSRAICRLQAQRRWAVTGTPVQNRLDDLGALIKFLRLKPFDDKRGFAQHILAPCKNADPEILPKLRLLVDSVTLRRLKDRIDLPKRTDKIVRLDFSFEERGLYEVFAKNASDRVAVLTHQREKSLGGRSYVHILQSILRLRLICAHGKELLSEEDLKVLEGVSKSSAIDLDSDDEEDKPVLSQKQVYDMYNLMRETNADTCSICAAKIAHRSDSIDESEGKDITIGHMTPCFHLLCTSCMKDYKAAAEQRSGPDRLYTACPLCNAHIRLSLFPLHQSKIDSNDAESPARATDSKDHTKPALKDLSRYEGPHTKTKALIEDLVMSRNESALLPEGESPIKSVVFSGWTSHLDLIQIALEANQIAYVRLDGKMTRVARAAALETFRLDPTVPVILVSIAAGGLGLNLTSANKVYVMEPQYNPAAEAQAIDRVHRLGQKREVETVRYVMRESFEEKMLVLQDKKMKLASLSMDREGASSAAGKGDRAEAARRRLQDLRDLFK